MLTAKRLCEVLRYEPETGKFYWRITSKYSKVRIGDEAGCSRKNDGYWIIGIDRRRYIRHHLVWLYVYGRWPLKGKVIDHINRRKTDDRICNLRETTWSENNYNRTRKSTHGVSPAYKGKYQAKLHLGSFDTFEEAIDAYRKAEILWRSFSYGSPLLNGYPAKK